MIFELEMTAPAVFGPRSVARNFAAGGRGADDLFS